MKSEITLTLLPGEFKMGDNYQRKNYVRLIVTAPVDEMNELLRMLQSART